ncbi:hypothetical protein [Halioxenophilus sp. WMMB6]|uniref:hypothetical protein n=1 Tax=Halioxenophilus sp. WMMB6 TaxID=3073815 RepID=UPI00295E8387|nr:hypothetical protein [Halioxenophilus sp. WMMB6]
MSRTLKAALLTAFIFPGLGHFYLNCRITGAIHAIVTSVALALFVVALYHLAQAVAADLSSGQVALSLDGLWQSTQWHLAEALGTRVYRTGGLVILFWLLATIDSLRAAWLNPANKPPDVSQQTDSGVQ